MTERSEDMAAARAPAVSSLRSPPMGSGGAAPAKEMTSEPDLSVLPSAAPDALDLPMWEGCRRGELLIHRCDVCGRVSWPSWSCTEHGGHAMSWVPAAGTGTLHTFTVYHHAYSPEMAGHTPYVVAIVRLDEGPDVHTSIVGCAPDDCRIGMRVAVEFELHPEGYSLPVFRPVT